jgi:hypothetical protein
MQNAKDDIAFPLAEHIMVEDKIDKFFTGSMKK